MKKTDMFSVMGDAARQVATGAFLMTGDKANPMTIGWCQWGVIWGKPICTVFVRKSRFSHELIQSGRFTVSVPRHGEKNEAIKLCGAVSGRDSDKLALLSLEPVNLEDGSKGFPDCGCHFNCRVVYSTDMELSKLDEDIQSRYYAANQATPDGDPHTIYFAEVESVFVED